MFSSTGTNKQGNELKQLVKTQPKKKKKKTDLVKLEPLVIRRIKNSLNVGLALCRKRPIWKNKIHRLYNRFRPFLDLFLENLTASSEPMKAQNSGFLQDFALAPHLSSSSSFWVFLPRGEWGCSAIFIFYFFASLSGYAWGLGGQFIEEALQRKQSCKNREPCSVKRGGPRWTCMNGKFKPKLQHKKIARAQISEFCSTKLPMSFYFF